MKPIRFNDTSDYQYIEVLEKEGVFTPLRIERESLPEGFYKYSLREGEEALFSQVAGEVAVNHAGDLITKEPLDLGTEGSKKLGEDDWGFTDKPFIFEAYFGQKLSIDCQIAEAEAKREAQMNGPKSQAKVKSNPLDKEI